MRCALVLIALLFCSACEETVVLGTECPAQNGVCEKRQSPTGDENDTGMTPPEGDRDGGDGSSQPNMDLDGGKEEPQGNDASQRDAGDGNGANVAPPKDARPTEPEDAGPALFPPFVNPSFELVDGGREGDVVETTPGAPSPVETSIAPWYTCRRGISVSSSVTYGLPGNQYTVRPVDGDTFITDTFPIVVGNANGITQDLSAPLLPGQRYAFAVEVWAERDPLMFSEPVLELAVSDGFGCLLGRKIGMSQSITPDGWRKACITFTTPAVSQLQPSIRTLMLLINAPNDPVNFAPMHFDNIRPDPECGNVVSAP
jgi:hypothetical protein